MSRLSPPKKILTLPLTIGLSFLNSLPVLAQTSLENAYEKLRPFSDVYNMRGLLEGGDARSEFIQRIAAVVNIFLSLLVITMVILIMYGGYLWLTARGNEKQVEDAKHTIKSAIIGTFIIMLAVAITFFVVRGIRLALTD
jgi:cytochrome bd-type quinol oxidase subunit 1